MNKTRVVLGMSGGVDSSVAAYLLQQQGYDVVGVTMKVWPQDCISRAEDKCCGPSAIADARGVAHTLGIPHYVIDEAVPFEKLVIDYFASEYQAGRTPNPCVMCNEKLKFGNLWSKAHSLGAEWIATGHYAIIEHFNNDDGTAHAVLRKGRDARKDQSYFLFSLRQKQLQRALCPLGAMSKPEIREIARNLGLKVAEKADSQEICFVPGNDYKAFLRTHFAGNDGAFHPGGIFDKAGTFLAKHDGIEMFTIGQRKGLPGGSPAPRYVIDIDPETSSVIVGDAEDLVCDEFEVNNVNWLDDEPDEPREINVKIRYAHAGTEATIFPGDNGTAHIRLHEPQRAITPGQAAVFYDGDVVLGGGWICRQQAARPNVFSGALV
ncbi:MAG: tRNA-uridine 2-sulfurtransferase [Chthoniobacter sp.]|jgi:tRNA-specific 2-thiouridylase|nr:tRNA-uridine 2-sulfurtransferase [Chthoniobacter sp.]